MAARICRDGVIGSAVELSGSRATGKCWDDCGNETTPFPIEQQL